MAHKAGLDEAVIARAAGELADAVGFERLSIAELATRLGVRGPSLYKHIGSLAEIRRGVALLAARELAGRLLKAAAGKNGAEGILAVADAYRQYAREHPGCYAAVQRAPDPTDPSDKALIEANTEILAVLRAVLAPYKLHGQTEVHALRTLRSLAHGFVTLELAGGFGWDVDLDASFAYAFHQFLQGIDRHPSDGYAGSDGSA
jgi:AcrR family transcriptional regulator